MAVEKKEIASWTRWLHIYLSMFSFAALLFFSVTGITLNHPEWIEGQQVTEQLTGTLDHSWVETTESLPAKKLELVEYFRNTHNIKSSLADVVIEADECRVSFKGPGYAADIFIDRAGASYEITITKSGAVAILNDLHKGRDAGTAWAMLIDISAALMIIVSLSGFLMIFFLRKKRVNGILIAALGGVLMIMLYYLFAQ